MMWAAFLSTMAVPWISSRGEGSVTFGEGNTQRTETITFDMVDISYPYNAIFGRNTIIKFGAVIHQTYLCMKLPTAGGVITILGNQEEAHRCVGTP